MSLEVLKSLRFFQTFQQLSAAAAWAGDRVFSAMASKLSLPALAVTPTWHLATKVHTRAGREGRPFLEMANHFENRMANL